MKRMPQMKRNKISVEPKVYNLCTSVPSAVCLGEAATENHGSHAEGRDAERKSFAVKNRYQGTADYADGKDGADEEKQYQR
jgi:hypothetical protein